MDPRIDTLTGKGVRIVKPDTIELGAEVRPENIAEGVTLHAGCRIHGSKTVIMAGASLGREATVTVEDCQIAPGVELQGGYFRKSVFLEKASLGSGAQVREACILEEEANGAHTVGIKQTIPFPFVTLGSLVNFCDVPMAGGTSRRDHSEVGSSYIHFNYTPNQDKATPSIMGDVPRGVLLGERPVFLGGQGGLVGPAAIGFGSVIAAGIVYRGDLGEGRLVVGEELGRKELSFIPGVYFEIERKVKRNLDYIGSLVALRQWYSDVRGRFFTGDPLEQALHAGAMEKLEIAFDEEARAPAPARGKDAGVPAAAPGGQAGCPASEAGRPEGGIPHRLARDRGSAGGQPQLRGRREDQGAVPPEAGGERARELPRCDTGARRSGARSGARLVAGDRRHGDRARPHGSSLVLTRTVLPALIDTFIRVPTQNVARRRSGSERPAAELSESWPQSVGLPGAESQSLQRGRDFGERQFVAARKGASLTGQWGPAPPLHDGGLVALFRCQNRRSCQKPILTSDLS